MTMPSLPVQGSTNWYAWAQKAHAAAAEVTDGRLTDAALRATSVAAGMDVFGRTQDGVLTAPRARPPVNASLLTGMQTGHGYVNNSSTAATLTDDTTDFLLGSQSLRFTTKTDFTPASIQKGGLSIDTTGKFFRILVKVSDLTNVSDITFYAVNDAGFTNYYSWTIAGPDPAGAQTYAKAGEWAWITLAWNQAIVVGTPTRTGITLLRLRGRATDGNSLTVNWNAVALVEESTAYPNGVVSFAYDDSYLTTFTEARKALDKYGWVGTAYTICDLVGSGGQYMSLAQLKALHRAGWEVAAHSYTVADHATAFQNMTATQLHANFRQMRQWLTDNGFTGGDHLAYPQGGYNPAVLDVVGQYFVSARTTNRQLGETLRPGDALRLRSASVTTDTVSSLTTKIDQAKANKSWAILTFHDLTASPTGGTEYSIANHQAIVDYCNTVGVAVRTVGEVLRTAA